MTRVVRIRSTTELQAIEPVWATLEAADRTATFFQSWSWNWGWCRTVLPGLKGARLDIRLLEDDAGRPLAILPLYQEKVAGPILRVVQFLAKRMSTNNGFLLADPSSDDLADLVIGTLRRHLGPLDILHLRHLDGAAAITRRLAGRGLADWLCGRAVVVADATIGDQRQRLSRRTRRVTRERENKLKREFDVSYRLSSGEGMAEAFDELIDLHNRRFTSTGRQSLLTGDHLRFLRQLVLEAGGRFEIVQLRADNRTIAAELAIRDRNSYVFYQGGFDPEFSKFAPMRLLFAEVLRRAFDDLGYASCDLGAAIQSYKLDWQPQLGASYSSCVGGPGPYAKVLATAYHAAFKRRFPKPAHVKEE